MARASDASSEGCNNTEELRVFRKTGGKGRQFRVLGGLLILASLSALTWALLHRRHTAALRVGYSNYPPYMRRLAGGKASGFAVEILSEAARRSHIPIQWIAVDWPADEALAAGKIDVFPFLAISDERRSKLALSRSWWESNLGLVALKSRTLPVKGGEGYGLRPIFRHARHPWRSGDFRGPRLQRFRTMNPSWRRSVMGRRMPEWRPTPYFRSCCRQEWRHAAGYH